MKLNTWTNDEIDLLINNFTTNGIDECLKLINYNESKIRRMAYKLRLKINKNVKKKYKGKSNDKCNINPELFYNINKKEVVYFLGLLWNVLKLKNQIIIHYSQNWILIGQM
jgi:hypothetical protein